MKTISKRLVLSLLSSPLLSPPLLHGVQTVELHLDQAVGNGSAPLTSRSRALAHATRHTTYIAGPLQSLAEWQLPSLQWVTGCCYSGVGICENCTNGYPRTTRHVLNHLHQIHVKII